ncbi:MAG: glycosyltransferase family 4 protein [Geobacter sp.]|nr:glycosyltransferase family 4 protein [Geobacter sp.]
MNICIDARPLQNAHRVRGVGVLLRNLLEHMGGLAVEDDVTLVTLRGKELRRLFRKERRIETFRIDRPNRFNWIADHLLLPGLVRRSGAEVFLATDFNSYMRPMRGMEVVSMAYDLIPFVFLEAMAAQPLPVRIGWRTNFAKLKESRRIIAISEATRNDLVGLFGIEPARIEVIHPGIDHALFNVSRAADEIARRKILGRYGIVGEYFLYVGDSEWRKNLRRALEALAGLDAAAKLVIVGKKAPTDPLLGSWIDEFGLREKVVLCGFVPDGDLPLLYGGATAFLFPSLYEGFGFPVAEAMACGCPVITSNVSSMPEVAGDAAILVDPESVDEIRGAMQQLRNDVGLGMELRRAGPCQAARFDWEQCARATLSVLRRASETARKGNDA